MSIAAEVEVVSRYSDYDIAPEVDVDPYTPLMRLAAKAPVVAGRHGLFDGIPMPNSSLFPDDDRDVFLALSWDACKQVTSDHINFSSEQGNHTLRKTFGKTLMSMDEPEHGRYRKLVLPSFSHRMVTSELVKMAKPIIDECLDRIAPLGRAELIGSFISVFPYIIIAKLFGVPPELAPESEQLVNDALRMGDDPVAALAALDGMDKLYQKIIDRHRLEPVDDLTNALMNAEIDGRKLTDAEVVGFIKQIIAAGLDTTVRQLGNLIYLLLENPDQFDDLRANPEMLDPAIWESLRVVCAAGLTPRVAVNDVNVCGVTIPAGSGVYAVIHSANLDPDRWPDPQKFDIRRKRIPIASFGAGVHACIGLNLAIAEMSVAMVGVLARLPNLRKDPERWAGTVVRGFQLRSPTRLPVIWDAEG